MADTALILMGHGSRHLAWQKTFENLQTAIQDRTQSPHLYLCYMEVAEPSLKSVAQLVWNRGLTQARILPLFMSSGGHVTHDIPAQITAVNQTFPNLNLTLLPAVGEHPIILAALQDIAHEILT